MPISIVADLALLESAFLFAMGALLVVLGGLFLVSRDLIDRVSSVLILVSGVYAILWQEPLLLGVAGDGLLSVEVARTGFLVALSGAVFLWAYWLFQRHVEVLEATRDDLREALLEGQVYIDVISHDVRNPLTTAMNRLDLAKTKHPPVIPDLEAAEAALARIEGLIDQSLLLSRISHDPDPVDELVPLPEIVETCVEAVGPLADDHNVTLAVDLRPCKGCLAHPLFGQAIENLVVNAIRWSPQGGRVELTAGRSGPGWEVVVVDHGPGISEDVKGSVFDSFERADGSEYEGLGLGLAITQRVVDMHDGTISIEETPGGGSTFRIHVPPTDGDPVAMDPGLPSSTPVPADPTDPAPRGGA